MTELGVRFYDGPSLLTGDLIVGVITGLDRGSHNSKTGAVAQAWVLRPDLPPQAAKRQNLDDAVCGDCKLRGRDGQHSGCYVPGFWPANVYRQLEAYPVVSWPELHAVLEGRMVRLCAYGDPAAIPFDVWAQVLTTAASWVGYTHSWRVCDPRFKTIAMASVDTVAEFHEAQRLGWRTFRVRPTGDYPLVAGAEAICPASDEGHHRTTCARCELCRGTQKDARSIAIIAHGHNGVMTAFYRNRSEARA